ncbi:hypothetical protein HJFPF1_09976 [Paramyrothecium foliicola]|nr:hypothetical protein HJFPF1_09976 [Paramyrothecium foliicola]
MNDPTSPTIATLKLLSTLAVRYEAHAHRFLPFLNPILDMLNLVDTSASLFQPPTSVIVSCLASLPIDQSPTLPPAAVGKLADALQWSPQTPQTHATERQLLPLLMAVLHIAESRSSAARSKLSEYILPSEEDRVHRLGQGTSLPHRLINLSSKTMDPETREIISMIYFNLSNNNPPTFLSQEEITQHQGGEEEPLIYHITGQLYNNELPTDTPNMTDEEKEREAERLLRANGLVSVENPMTQFQSSGRFEELPDDESE